MSVKYIAEYNFWRTEISTIHVVEETPKTVVYKSELGNKIRIVKRGRYRAVCDTKADAVAVIRKYLSDELREMERRLDKHKYIIDTFEREHSGE